MSASPGSHHVAPYVVPCALTNPNRQRRARIQDPVARVFSAWRMTYLAERRKSQDQGQPCLFPSFKTTVVKTLEDRKDDPCFFQAPVRPNEFL
jgi:hypothetical protein